MGQLRGAQRRACCPISLKSSLIVCNRECTTSKDIYDRRNKRIPITNLSDCLNCCCEICTTIAEDPRSGADPSSIHTLTGISLA